MHTPVPSIFAVQGVIPRAMFTPICTSITLTVPSAFRSQAFELLLLLLDVLLLDAALKEAVLAQYGTKFESHCDAYVPLDDVRRCAQPFPFSVASFMNGFPE